MLSSSHSHYVGKLLHAGAILSDTRVLLNHWDISLSATDNMRAIRDANIIGKTSAYRIDDILTTFRERYVVIPEYAKALAILVQNEIGMNELAPICYYLTTQNDRLLYDAIIKVILPLYRSGYQEVTTLPLRNWIADQVRQGNTTSQWSESTRQRMAQGILATLRDFHVLEGRVKKRIVTPLLPPRAFAMIAFLLQKQQQSGKKVLHHPDWQLFFLEVPEVERHFFIAHKEHLLTYQAAGSVIRIDFGTTSLEEYAHALAKRVY